jgi:transposase
METELHPFIGVDISKERLDIGVSREGESWQANNDEVGIRLTAGRLAEIQPALVVVESTGGLETALIVELCTRQIPVALVNPGRVTAGQD